LSPIHLVAEFSVFDIASNDKLFSILVELVEPVSYLLTIRLNSEVCLPKCNDLLARIAVLDNEIASVSGELIILDFLRGCTCFYDFVDLNKIVNNIVTTVVTRYHRIWFFDRLNTSFSSMLVIMTCFP